MMQCDARFLHHPRGDLPCRRPRPRSGRSARKRRRRSRTRSATVAIDGNGGARTISTPDVRNQGQEGVHEDRSPPRGLVHLPASGDDRDAHRLLASLDTYFARSTRRLEYPHLSYQARTFTIFPAMTFVDNASKADEHGSWLKSMETSGASTYWRIPFSGPSAAFIAALTSAVTALESSAVRSTTDTFGVGTRIAIPSSFLQLGDEETALAAPVVVGIIAIRAARARRRSLWGRSRIFWSFV